MSAAPSRWRFALLPWIALCITLPNLIGRSDALAQPGLSWRPLVLQALLVLAGGVVVAATAFGVVAWRGARA